jgi:hypothetical protein
VERAIWPGCEIASSAWSAEQAEEAGNKKGGLTETVGAGFRAPGEKDEK